MAYDPFSARQDMDVLINGCPPAYMSHHADHIQQLSFQGVIDPGLMSDSSQLQRYLDDPHRPVFDAPHMLPPTHVPSRALQSDSITALPFRSQGRHESPFSQHQSSTASSAQSPRTENDQCHDSTHGPSTPPPDMKSPYLTHVNDNWDGQLLTGLSPYQTDGYVNLSDIHPSQVSLGDYNESDGSKSFSLDTEFNSFDVSNTSIHYRGEAVTQAPMLRISSPESEIHVRSSLDPIYPDPENICEETLSTEEAAVEPSSRIAGSRRRTSTMSRDKSTPPSKNTNHRGRPRRPAMSTLTDPSKVNKNTSASRDPTSRRLPSSQSTSLHICPDCHDPTFKDDVALQKHIKSQHKRPFTCVFHFAGCTEAFANKNEWKRHVSAQHLSLYFWLCTHGGCGQVMTQDYQVSGAITHGRPFRRKDLFTQHVRRMHPFPSPTGTGRNKSVSPERDDPLKEMQEAAFRKRCEMPTHMRCPAQGCTRQFNGDKTWDDRMEHVARHLERAANKEEPKVRFGTDDDTTLIDWAASESVNVIHKTSDGRWALGQPLKNSRVNLKTVPGQGAIVDEDAEGEAC
ncbi:hypothetical protein G7Z17_g11150 [Cylindrodendrum hubeiense]|uniref:C2H2-type domain-containing protein n=1 Tax=Cylindrodendrum hubeiense TaxID=595255 RepID=A0A9P5LBY1_9HYPO|nr:hypothetical protein G7Z17_g11150 [Cylindrodendrum hubeiense]